MAKVKEKHTLKLEQAMDKAVSVKESYDQSQDEFKILQTELDAARTKLAESVQVNKDLKRLRASSDESLKKIHGQITELQRQKAALTTQLAEAKNVNKSNQETMISLQFAVESHEEDPPPRVGESIKG